MLDTDFISLGITGKCVMMVSRIFIYFLISYT